MIFESADGKSHLQFDVMPTWTGQRWAIQLNVYDRPGHIVETFVEKESGDLLGAAEDAAEQAFQNNLRDAS